MSAPLTITLRPMLPDDGPVLASIFAASIDELTGAEYSPEQQTAWIATAESEVVFAKRLAGWLTILAVVDGDVAGFASLKAPDTLEMLYVRPDAAGQGIGSALCDALEKIAAARGAAALGVTASDTAQPFFTKRGYASIDRKTVLLEDEWLGGTVMRKALTQDQARQH